MADKKYKGAPFGVQTARFDVSGIHPKSKVPGTFTQTPYCKKATDDVNAQLGPGRYEVDQGGFSSKTVAERAEGPGWARAYEVSKMAALPHLLHKDQWEMKRILQRKLGPGSYEIKDFLKLSEEKPRSTRGIVQTKEQRFKEKVPSETPGPGTYGKGGVPHAAVEDKDRKSTSTIGMLDSRSASQRSLPSVGSHLGPGSYNNKSFTEEMAQKVTSTKGPYDLFSGDRNKPMKTGHFAAPAHSNLGPGQYSIKSFIEEMNGRHKSIQGHFSKMVQYPEKPNDRIYSFSLSQNPRQPDEPGPGQYNPQQLRKPLSQGRHLPGFLSSAQRNDRMAQKFFTRNFNPVGPGRYDIQKRDDAQHKNGHQSVFRSKTDRPESDKQKFLFERIRAKDLRKEDRVFLVPPENPYNHLTRSKTHMTRSLMPDQRMTAHRPISVA